MSEGVFDRARVVAVPPDLAARFFADGEAWFRLNPEWEVRSFESGRLTVRYERSEEEICWRVTTAEFGAAGGTVVLEGEAPRTIALRWEPIADGRILLGWRETFPAPLAVARLAELGLWFDATAGYLALAARRDRRARLGKWLLDRFWLRLSPTARRVGIIIIAMEAMALLLFVAVLLVDRVLG